MHKKIILLILVIFNSLYFSLSQEPAKKTENIDFIIKKSGIESQLEVLPTQVETGLLQYKTFFGSDFENVKNIYKKNLNQNLIVSKIREYMTKEYNEKFANGIVEFYKTKNAIKITQLEVQTAKDPKHQEKVSKVVLDSIPEKRIKIR